MSEQSKRLLRGSARATTGVVVMGVAVAAAFALGSGFVALPTVERGVVAVDVDISQNAKRSLVCTGAFAELGADPTNPSESVPSGNTALSIAGRASDTVVLERTLSGGTDPVVLQTPSTSLIAAAEVQQVDTTTLQGLVASSCAEPSHEQWLVGGATQLGQSVTVVLGNPAKVPATVQLSVYDEQGQLDSAQTAGVLVPAESQRIVSLNGYAPSRDRLAVRVDSTGAAVTAALGIAHTIDIRSYAVDLATRQLAPVKQLVMPAVVNFVDHDHAPVDGVGEDDAFAVVVRVLAPAGESGRAKVSALKPDGVSVPLGSFNFEGAAVVDYEIESWPEDAQAVVIDADAAIVGSVFASSDRVPDHDYAWFAPAPMLHAGVEAAAAIVEGGELVLANPGAIDADVTIRTQSLGEAVRMVRVPAGSAITVAAQDAVTLKSSEPIAAGVRIVQGGYLAGYPVLTPLERAVNLTVYPR